MSPPRFHVALARHGTPLRRAALSELQINLGRLCNQACHHCHVDAGPLRTEIMAEVTMERIVRWVRRFEIRQVDITGGAPELNPHFRRLVENLRAMDVGVTARCNLTVLLEPGQGDLADWYAAQKVRLVCSLPCYTQDNVDAQRGRGVFDKSIRALKIFNAVGYGRHPQHVIDLVYNPGGAFLPPPQSVLQADYKSRLKKDFGIVFNELLALANLPINRFAHQLTRDGQLMEYRRLLADAFNPATVPALMCRHLISVDWRGRVYDCDFNQMLDLPLGGGAPVFLWDLEPTSLAHRAVAVGDHCFGCTAGAGSSCAGALAQTG